MAGVNQRRSKPSSCLTRNAVSERFISRATLCIQPTSRATGKRQTAAGLPANGVSVNASTCVIRSPTARKCSNKGVRVQFMIAAGSGLASGGTADDNALEASLEALGRSGTDRADLALVFVAADTYPRAHELLHAVRRVTGARAVLGCSGSGILTDRREVEEERSEEHTSELQSHHDL